VWLKGAYLDGAVLHRTNLEGARLDDAHLEGAKVLADAYLEGAEVTPSTSWPKDFNWKDANVRMTFPE
jgi:uncharacterized protein YjbI with pentapeptide repeats